MTPKFDCLAVAGLGLLGGSVALAARRAGIAGRVIGSTRRADARERALREGAIDAVVAPEEAAREADLLVLATPLYAMPELLRRMGPALADGAIVTDVGSVKAPLLETLPGLLPPGVAFVGSHPMAGSHERGMDNARADLFDGAPCIVTTGGDEAASERVCGFWQALGARVLRRAAERHDDQVAWVSHVPHLLAFAFARALAHAPQGSGELAGAGFRDFTRIARSESELWSDILTANRKSIAAPLQAVSDAFGELSRTIESGDAEGLEQQLAQARAALAEITEKRSSPERGGARETDRPDATAKERR